jgi:hypothetical protein
MQPKPAIFALSGACMARGTGSSNPSPSTGESANFQSLSVLCVSAPRRDQTFVAVALFALERRSGRGLVPFWAKDIKVGFANINAKAEGIESKPAFREALQRRRCLFRSITSTSGCDVKSCV